MTEKTYYKYVDKNLGAVSRIAAEVAEQKTKSMREQTAEEYRKSQNILADARTIPLSFKVEKQSIAGVPCEWVSHRLLNNVSKVVILYIHGGSWMFGNLETARPVAPMLIKETGFKVLIVDYRRAPEHKYPAGFNDVYAVYNQILEDGVDPNNIVVFGDSAGGNFSLALLNQLKADGKPLPRCVALASPVTDMRDCSNLLTADEDLIYTKYHGEEEKIFYVYLGKENYDNRDLPTISPITADLSGLPPVLIHAGGSESISADNIAYAKKMHEAGGEIMVKVWKDMFHDFTIVGQSLKESRESLKEIGEFYLKHFLKLGE